MTTPSLNRVLVVEDSPVYRTLLRRFLGMAHPHAVVEQYDPIKNGLPADDFDWSTYNLLILDYQLGGDVNGLDWLRQFRSNPQFPAVIVLTAEGDEDIAVQALKFGANEYLRKQTLTGKRLFQSIRQAMSDHEAKRRSANGVSLRHTLFNRAVFCHAVEQVASELESGAMKLALLVEIDGSVSIRQEQGFVMLDDLAGHLAERVVGLLGDAGYEYHVMRIADAAVAAVVSGYQGGDDGEMLAGNLCEHLEEQPYSAGGQFMPYTVSVGTARITSWKADGEAILGQADTACREAAAVSGNSYVVSKAADEQRNEPWNDSSELHRAFSDNRLQGCFQALMGASGRALKTDLRLYQMRVRLINDSGTSLLPKEFMPRLEAAGLLQTLDRWVLRHGVARLKSLYERNADPIGLFLRVTNASLVDSEFTSWLDELLQHAGSEVVSRSIILELEPQDVLTHSEETKQAVESLRARHGFRFALVNVPNEAVLRKCFDHIAFDFVKGAVLTDSESAQSAQDLSRLAMVLAAARDLGATTTADRIECAVVLSWAIRHQIDYVQGNFVSGPADHILENNITQNVEIA